MTNLEKCNQFSLYVESLSFDDSKKVPHNLAYCHLNWFIIQQQPMKQNIVYNNRSIQYKDNGFQLPSVLLKNYLLWYSTRAYK
jgi:hypothetical protein